MMKKIYSLFALLALFISAEKVLFAQNGVSINTTGTVPDNSAILDMSAETDKGMILPKVALTSTNIAGPIVLPATGLMVWNTAVAGVAPFDVTPGLYYNSGTAAAPDWKRVASGTVSSDWTLDGNSNGALKAIGTNDNFDFPIEANGTERMRVTTSGNVGIGTAAPNASALLDITSASKGFLLPRVALTATNLAGPIAAPATGLMVYNTALAGVAPNNVTPGQYYWDGVKWVRYATGNVGWDLLGNAGTVAATNFIGTTDAIDFVTRTNNTERMRVTSTGLVGIATAAPKNELQVGQGGDPIIRIDGALNTAAAGHLRFTETFATDYGFDIRHDASADVLIFSGLQANAAAPDNLLVLKRFPLTNQGVGIGTVAPDPSAYLDITSTSKGLLIPRVALTATNAAGPITAPLTSLMVYNTATAGVAPNNVTPGYYYWDGAAWARFTTGNNVNPWLLDGNTNGVIRNIGTNDNFDLPIETNGTERMRITTSGLVGIGTTTPTNKLSIIANSAQGVGIYSGNALNTFLTIGRNFAGEMTLGIPDAPNNFLNGTVAGDGVLRIDDPTKKLVFGAGVGINPTMVLTTNNVGIGTTAPNASALLDLTSTTRGLLVPRVALTATNAAGPIAAPATSLLVYNTAVAGVAPNNVTPGYYYWDGAAWLRFDTGNNAGDWKLIGNSNSAPSTSAIGVAANNNFIGTINNVDWVMATNNLERMRIAANGNVGIGTLTPRGIFDVQTLGDVYLANNTIAGTTQSLYVPGHIYISPYNGGNISYLQARRSDNSGTTSLRFRTYNAGVLTEAVHIEGNGFTGVGTITPATIMEVSSGGIPELRISSTGAFGAARLGFTSDKGLAGYWRPGYIESADGGGGGIFQGRLDFYTNGTGFANAFGSLRAMSILNGNVGIGTIQPNAPLQFANLISNRKIVLWEDANNDHQIYGFGINGSMLRYQVSSTGADHTFYAATGAAASNELMRILGNGNVGIGIPVPLGKFHVESTGIPNIVSRSSSTIGTWLSINNSSVGGQWFNIISTGSANGEGPGKLLFSRGASQSAIFSHFMVFDHANANIGMGVNAPDPSAYLDINSGTRGVLLPRVALTSSVTAGPILNPQTALLVYNTAAAGVAPNNVVPGYYYNSGTPGAPVWKRFGTGNGDAWNLTGNAGTIAAANFIGTTDAIDFVTRTNNAERMRVTSAGNVGIGTAAPGANARLHVAGGAIRPEQGNAVAAGINWGADIYGLGAGDQGYLRYYTQGGEDTKLLIGNENDADDDISFYQFGAERMTIYNGNVGVGTVFPSARLESNGASGDENTFGILRVITPAAGANLRFGVVDASRSWIQSHGGLPLYINTLGNNVIFNLNASNVGIGAAAPATKLAVNGNGVNVYNTDIWTENNIHVQGNEVMAAGGRGRLRVGSAWGYQGLYTDPTSTGVNNDLVLGASSGRIRIGPDNQGNQWLYSNPNYKTAANASGIYILNGANATPGTGYGAGTASASIKAYNFWGNSFDFAIAGFSFHDFNRSGGVMGGNNGGGIWSSLGYRASNATIYGLYYTTVGTGGGFMQNDASLTTVGSGGTGELMGSWTKGEVFGSVNAGELAASYNKGNEYTSGYSADLVSTTNGKTAAFSMTSTDLKIYADGKSNLQGGTVFVPFSNEFKALMSDEIPTVTVSPMGESNGIYIKNVSKDGFYVKENNAGTSTVEFSWIAIAKRIDAKNAQVPQDILNKEFDRNLEGFMFNENNKEHNATPIWWDGEKLRYDAIPEKYLPKKESEKKK